MLAVKRSTWFIIVVCVSMLGGFLANSLALILFPDSRVLLNVFSTVVPVGLFVGGLLLVRRKSA